MSSLRKVDNLLQKSARLRPSPFESSSFRMFGLLIVQLHPWVSVKFIYILATSLRFFSYSRFCTLALLQDHIKRQKFKHQCDMWCVRICRNFGLTYQMPRYRLSVPSQWRPNQKWGDEATPELDAFRRILLGIPLFSSRLCIAEAVLQPSTEMELMPICACR